VNSSTKALLLVPLIVFGVVTVFFAFGYLLTLVLGMNNADKIIGNIDHHQYLSDTTCHSYETDRCLIRL